MKKFIKCLVVLFLVLSLYGCKNNDDGATASINEVFYTNVDPDGMAIDGLDRVTNIRDDSYCHYYLVLSCRQPDRDVVKLIMQYDYNDSVREDEYLFGRTYSDVNLVVWWSDAYWNFTNPESNKELRCYLEDSSGRRSEPYTFHINLVQG